MTRRHAVLAFVVLAAAAAARADSALGWRGDGTGRFPHATPVIEWSADRTVLWKTPTPAWSNASPVIVGERIFVCAEPSTLLCLNKADGKILWQRPCGYDTLPAAEGQAGQTRPASRPAAMPPCSEVTGYSTPTPASDGVNVYAVFGTGVAACYDMDGRRLWARLVERPTHVYGHSSSPVLAGGKLLVHVQSLWALRASDGQTLWTTPSPQSFGTPVIARVGGRDLAVTAMGDFIRVDDGVKIVSKAGNLIYSSPVMHNGVVYFPQNNAWGVPLPATAEPTAAAPARTFLAGGRKERFYASSLIHDGLLYVINQSSQFEVLDLAGGAALCQRKLDLGGGSTYPSIALAGGSLFISSDTGVTLVLSPGRDPRQLARNSLEPFRSTPVFEGTRMYVRTLKHVYCIGK